MAVHLIQDIFMVVKHIQRVYATIQCAKRRCATMVKRVEALCPPLQRLKDQGKEESSKKTLIRLLDCLKECYRIIKKFAEPGQFARLKRWARSGSDCEAFSSMQEELSTCVVDLNLELSIDMYQGRGAYAAEQCDEEYADLHEMETSITDNRDQVLAHLVTEVAEGKARLPPTKPKGAAAAAAGGAGASAGRGGGGGAPTGGAAATGGEAKTAAAGGPARAPRVVAVALVAPGQELPPALRAALAKKMGVRMDRALVEVRAAKQASVARSSQRLGVDFAAAAARAGYVPYVAPVVAPVARARSVGSSTPTSSSSSSTPTTPPPATTRSASAASPTPHYTPAPASQPSAHHHHHHHHHHHSNGAGALVAAPLSAPHPHGHGHAAAAGTGTGTGTGAGGAGAGAAAVTLDPVAAMAAFKAQQAAAVAAAAARAGAAAGAGAGTAAAGAGAGAGAGAATSSTATPRPTPPTAMVDLNWSSVGDAATDRELYDQAKRIYDGGQTLRELRLGMLRPAPVPSAAAPTAIPERKGGYAWRYVGCRLITDSAMSHVLRMVGRTITRLDLSACVRITDATLGLLPSVCPNLVHLSVACCTLVTDTGLAALATGCASLASLDLTASSCSAARVVASIPNFRNLNSLRLGGLRVDDAGAIGVASRAPKLMVLDLSNTSVTDSACPDIASRLPALCSLDLSVTAVSDAGAMRLTALSKLVYLDLSLCAVAATTAAAIRAALPACNVIRH